MDIQVSKKWGLNIPFDELCEKALFGFRAAESHHKDDMRPHFAMKRHETSTANYKGIDYVLLSTHRDGVIENAEGFIAHELLTGGRYTFYKDCKEMVADWLKSCDCSGFIK